MTCKYKHPVISNYTNHVQAGRSEIKFINFSNTKLMYNNSLKIISFSNHNTIFARISAFI